MSFFKELKRRNVFKVGIAYVVAAWLLLQLTEVLTELLELDTDIGKIVILLLVVGFVPALIFAWAFEMTPEGIKRESEVDRSRSVAQQTGRKLDFAVIGMLALVAAYFIWEARFKNDVPGEPDSAVSTSVVSATPAAPTVTADEPTSPLQADAIAVLPFANRSMQESDLFFTDGIHDDLLTQLAKIDDLKVISRTSVMEYRDTTKKIPEIATELGVGKILEGGVQRAGDRVRINAQLIDVATDQHLWAETFDREMTIDNIFDIQSEITRQIVAAVKGELSAEERASLSDRPTDNLAAWEAFLHARAIMEEPDYGADKYRRAEPFAREAVALDPDFAKAWAILANIQMQGIWIGYENTEAQREAVRESLARAKSLDPDDPDVMAAQADYFYRVEVDYASSLALIEEALEDAPRHSELHRERALSLRRLGRWEESVQAFEQALELDPLNADAASTLVETLNMMNAWDRLEPIVDFWLRKEPDSGDLLNFKAMAMLHRRGELDAAWRLLEPIGDTRGMRVAGARVWLATMRGDWDQAVSLAGDREDRGFLPIQEVTADLRLGWIYALKGDMETARGHFADYVAHTNETGATGRIARGFRHVNLAQVYAWLGEPDVAQQHAALATEALPVEADHVFGVNIARILDWVLAKTGHRDEALERIAAKLDGAEGYTRWELYLDPAWDFFRDDPRFNDLVRPEGVEPEAFQRIGDGT